MIGDNTPDRSMNVIHDADEYEEDYDEDDKHDHGKDEDESSDGS